ncbi:hypothetical protein PUNSTDRAFT_133857 [Punctularia strigosozonata HHB-11173 SS5]|uniref:uncharacterized protein n=1 Tax=Punctularia strigosozonata (strain HHB-11173) TaxID=741275 RepID=UPI0004416E74|nr:uncharacterized protein PUNSTDRAFT_133857 [Punctularia strigosozonata HHB-11173 SS5]EIN10092.1 hypothetical protein PUNSTDRAFT_133857 [Punctularia strigosozonata HHB-11173 SS5]
MASAHGHDASVDLLILGAGWTSTFLIPLCVERSISYVATTRSGNAPPTPAAQPSIQFEFDPTSDDPTPFTPLPNARTVLITFPIKVQGASERLVRLYKLTHTGTKAAFIQLGSTGIWDGGPTSRSESEGELPDVWIDRHSRFDTSNDRARAEMELLALSTETPTTVLNLCGLWGGKRSMRNWVGRVAPTKEVLSKKTSIHMIHGFDVARAILAVHSTFAPANGQRWLLTDGRVYDWWDLASAWGPQPKWVFELMEETGVRALPRDPKHLGRALDSREFWVTFGLHPAKARLERE